ncbi:MAG: Long-chain-fatty-acid--CoA ligase [Firmicutes bacterium ADurb.Bin300]|nr:MAG: Long-chain-fatty-acid--CoA ligase [Firmicutes bacterium ADurb.Bin300]
MKLSFSTNGWTGFSWKDYYTMAKDLGYKGIEIHNIDSDVFFGKNSPLSKRNSAATKRELANLELQITCLDAMCNIGQRDNLEDNCKTIERYIETAYAVGCPSIRLYALDTKGVSEFCDETVAEALYNLLPIAQQKGITLLIETAGIYADTNRLSNLLNLFASDYLGALWDLHHPYNHFKETPEQTVTNLGAYIKHVHIKDSCLINGKRSYCLMGEGDLPLEQMLDALRSINYDGFISLEWLPVWLPELSDAGIVFPHFINFMSRFDDALKGSGKLYSNRTGTGKFVWKKDTLIRRTFSQVLERMTEEFPDQLAVRFTTLDYTRTYSQFSYDVEEFAKSLIALGVKPGTHVAIWATNIPQWFITFWATTTIGAVLVTVNTAYKIYEAEYLLRQSDTHTLVMINGFRDSDYASIINEICPELKGTQAGQPLHSRRLPFLRNVITCGFKMDGCITWEEALAAGECVPTEEVHRRAAAVDAHDVCNMQYTSGTTGFPKGVMLTHYNIVNNGKCIGDRMDLSTADRLMIHVPMFHCFGMVLAMTAAMTHAATIYPLPYFSPKPALACINQERITAFHGVPTMFIAMLSHEDFPKTDFSFMRTGIMAGSPCPVAVMQSVVEKMNMKEITIVYGQTESSPGCTMSKFDDSLEVRVTTVGSPLPEIECRVINPETGEEVPDGVNGEFVARGYNIMRGYYKMPKATQVAIDEAGWLHTGDLAISTEDGNFKITGRLKDMIIRGGENIYPKEIEEFLYTHPKISDVQVIGVPDTKYGEEIMACIILKENEILTEDEVKEFVRSHMAHHKIPKYVDFVSEFSTNAAGKILKYKMREAAIEKLKLRDAAEIETA